MRSLISVLVAGSLLLAGCQAPPVFDPEDPAVVAELEALLQSMMAGAAEVDAGRVLAAAEGPGELTFITGDLLLSGLETIRPRFEETYAGLRSQQQTIHERRIRLLGPDVAVVMAVGEGTYTDKAGWTSEPVGIGTTLVFVRDNGEWRVRHAHQSIQEPVR